MSAGAKVMQILFLIAGTISIASGARHMADER